MSEEKIEQQVAVTEHGRVRDITLIGKQIVQTIKHPAQWQEALWHVLSKHYGFIIVVAVLEAALAGAYLRFRNLYLIPLWLWGLAAIALVAASWGWYVWGWLGRARSMLALALLSSLAFVGITGSEVWRSTFPERFAPEVFGIAIAEPGEGPDFQRTAKAREISQQVYEYLCSALKAQVGATQEAPCESLVEPSVSRRIALKQIGVISNSQSAQAYGQRIQADVVIWGQVLTTETGGVTIYFQVLETQDRAIDPLFPLILPVMSSSAEIFVKELDLESDPLKLKAIVAQEATIIASFTLGLRAYLDLDLPEAKTRFETAVRTIESNPSLQVPPIGQSLLYMYLGRVNNTLGRVETGQEWLKRAQTANPQEPAIPMSLALGYGVLGREQERDAHLRQALDLIKLWLETHPDDTAATYNRGLISEIQHQYEAAIEDFDAVIEHDPNYYIAYISSAQDARKLERYEQAEQRLREAIELADRTGTNPAWAYLHLGLTHEAAHQPELAKAAFIRAIALAPKVASMYDFYAQFLEDQQEMDAALSSYQQLVEVARDKGSAYSKMAAFLMRRNLPKQALAAYQRAIREQPDDTLTRTYLAKTYVALGDSQNALREFEAAINGKDVSYYVYASYGEALYQLDQFEQAAHMFEQSIDLRPADRAVLHYLDLIYTRLGRCQQARETYNRILEQHTALPEWTIQFLRERLQALKC